MTVPSGRSTCGPISAESASCTAVVPAFDQVPVAGSYFSELVGLVRLLLSIASTLPSGSSVQPSSRLASALPAPVAVQVRVVASRIACAVVPLGSARPIMKRPSGSTTLGAPPIVDQPLGGDTIDQLCATGHRSPRDW